MKPTSGSCVTLRSGNNGPSDTLDQTRPDVRPTTGRGSLGTGRLVGETFRLKGPIGQGGMAQVMLAHDIVLDREVALKFLGRNLLSNPESRARFAREARNMARVRHPHVAHIYSFGVHEGWPYFAMEYVSGGNLLESIRRRPRPSVAEVVAIVRQIASGLEAIHASGMVHHDVKPANVLMTEDGRVVLTDLGLARLVSQSDGKEVAGTPRYMAPEQTSLIAATSDHAIQTDIYQLGITTFELLVGSPPFDGAEPLEIFRHHRRTQPPPPSVARNGLSAAVDRVVLRALEKRPERRFESARAFSEALEEAAGVAAGRGGPPRPARPLRVLLADDDPAQLTVTRAVLALELPLGSEFVEATDGAAALNAVTENEFDVVVLDLHMPRMSGLDVAAALKVFRKRPRVVLVTGEGGAREWRALREAGGDAMLLKPLDMGQLVSAVERCAASDSPAA